jgi:hypothetical protein
LQEREGLKKCFCDSVSTTWPVASGEGEALQALPPCTLAPREVVCLIMHINVAQVRTANCMIMRQQAARGKENRKYENMEDYNFSPKILKK